MFKKRLIQFKILSGLIILIYSTLSLANESIRCLSVNSISSLELLLEERKLRKLKTQFSYDDMQRVLSEDEILTIDDYTDPGGDFDLLNRARREGWLSDVPDFVEFSRKFLAVLTKIPDYKGIVSRSASLPVDILPEYLEKENIVSDEAFISTALGVRLGELSTGVGEAPTEQDVKMIIKVHGGKDISSLNEQESEVILLPGSRFKILEVQLAGERDLAHHYIVYMEQL